MYVFSFTPFTYECGAEGIRSLYETLVSELCSFIVFTEEYLIIQIAVSEKRMVGDVRRNVQNMFGF